MPALPRSRRLLVVLAGAALSGAAAAHEYRAGPIVIDHPYAAPSADGTPTASVHFRVLRNAGNAPDRLLGARTAVADGVALQHTTTGASATTVAELPLPAGSETKMRHDGDWRLLLTGLKAQLKPGDSFALTLRFEKAGEKEVSIDVVQPRATHKH